MEIEAPKTTVEATMHSKPSAPAIGFLRMFFGGRGWRVRRFPGKPRNGSFYGSFEAVDPSGNRIAVLPYGEQPRARICPLKATSKNAVAGIKAALEEEDACHLVRVERKPATA